MKVREVRVREQTREIGKRGEKETEGGRGLDGGERRGEDGGEGGRKQELFNYFYYLHKRAITSSFVRKVFNRPTRVNTKISFRMFLVEVW